MNLVDGHFLEHVAAEALLEIDLGRVHAHNPAGKFPLLTVLTVSNAQLTPTSAKLKINANSGRLSHYIIGLRLRA